MQVVSGKAVVLMLSAKDEKALKQAEPLLLCAPTRWCKHIWSSCTCSCPRNTCTRLNRSWKVSSQPTRLLHSKCTNSVKILCVHTHFHVDPWVYTLYDKHLSTHVCHVRHVSSLSNCKYGSLNDCLNSMCHLHTHAHPNTHAYTAWHAYTHTSQET